MLLALFWLFQNFKVDYLAYFYELRNSDFTEESDKFSLRAPYKNFSLNMKIMLDIAKSSFSS